jgi:hypothetical protein
MSRKSDPEFAKLIRSIRASYWEEDAEGAYMIASYGFRDQANTLHDIEKTHEKGDFDRLLMLRNAYGYMVSAFWKENNETSKYCLFFEEVCARINMLLLENYMHKARVPFQTD